MKPAITTEYLHKINFYTASYQAEHGLAGLDLLISEASQKEIKFSTLRINANIVTDSLENIMPEVLDDMSYKRLSEIFETGKIEFLDLRTILQWLVNKEILPSGSYSVVF